MTTIRWPIYTFLPVRILVTDCCQLVKSRARVPPSSIPSGVSDILCMDRWCVYLPLHSSKTFIFSSCSFIFLFSSFTVSSNIFVLCFSFCCRSARVGLTSSITVMSNSRQVKRTIFRWVAISVKTNKTLYYIVRERRFLLNKNVPRNTHWTLYKPPLILVCWCRKNNLKCLCHLLHALLTLNVALYCKGSEN